MLRSLTSTPQHLLRAPPKLGVGPPAQYFTEQKQDHFDPASSRTWSQAFYVNDTFWRPGSDAPIFLCVGGEGPRCGTWPRARRGKGVRGRERCGGNHCLKENE